MMLNFLLASRETVAGVLALASGLRLKGKPEERDETRCPVGPGGGETGDFTKQNFAREAHTA